MYILFDDNDDDDDDGGGGGGGEGKKLKTNTSADQFSSEI